MTYRICHVMTSGAQGGGARHLALLCEAQVQRGDQVSAVVGDDGPLATTLASLGVRVSSMPLMAGRLRPDLVARLSARVSATGPDVVHAHGSRAGWLLGLLSRPPAPVVYTAHMAAHRVPSRGVVRWARGFAERYTCRRSAAVITVSRADGVDLERRSYVDPGRWHHIPNALRLDEFRPGDKDHARTQLGLPRDTPLVGTVGRLEPQKSVETLLEAVAALDGGVEVVVAGAGSEERFLRSRAQSLGVTVHWLGAVDAVAPVLRALDVFGLTSRWEAEGIVLLEAVACGIPTVATGTPGASEVMGAMGLAEQLVPVGEPTAVTDCLRRTFETPDDAWAKRLSRAQEALADRTPDVMAERTAAVYAEVLRRDH